MGSEGHRDPEGESRQKIERAQYLSEKGEKEDTPLRAFSTYNTAASASLERTSLSEDEGKRFSLLYIAEGGGIGGRVTAEYLAAYSPKL